MQLPYDVSSTLGFDPDHYKYNTSPVGTFAPNGYGLYDMAGNMLEWCLDFWNKYSSSATTDPHGPATGLSRVLRGGNWLNTAHDLRCAYRYHLVPSCKYHTYFGFRCVSH